MTEKRKRPELKKEAVRAAVKKAQDALEQLRPDFYNAEIFSHAVCHTKGNLEEWQTGVSLRNEDPVVYGAYMCSLGAIAREQDTIGINRREADLRMSRKAFRELFDELGILKQVEAELASPSEELKTMCGLMDPKDKQCINTESFWEGDFENALKEITEEVIIQLKKSEVPHIRLIEEDEMRVRRKIELLIKEGIRKDLPSLDRVFPIGQLLGVYDTAHKGPFPNAMATILKRLKLKYRDYLDPPEPVGQYLDKGINEKDGLSR